MKFNVTWGPESKEVDAPDADAAWPAFCTLVPAALKHPNLYERKVEAVIVAEDDIDSALARFDVSEEPTPKQPEQVVEPVPVAPESEAPAEPEPPSEPESPPLSEEPTPEPTLENAMPDEGPPYEHQGGLLGAPGIM